MFGSVSDLVLKAKHPPYKVATHTGSLLFNNLTGAILAVIKSQHSEPNVARLSILVPTDHEIDREHVGVDCDGTFSTDEANSARSRHRVTRLRTAPDASAVTLNELLSERGPIGFGLPPLSAYDIGGGAIQQREAAVRAVAGGSSEACSLLDQMRADAERGVQASGELMSSYGYVA